MIDYGLFEKKTRHDSSYCEELLQFMIMPRLGHNLENYFQTMNCQLPEVSIYALAIKVITLLECMHTNGLVFNDLKLDNLMVGYNDELPDFKYISDHTDVFEKCTINLVDFGFVTSILNKRSLQHVDQKQNDMFRGNVMFASLN